MRNPSLAVLTDTEFNRYAKKYADNAMVADEINAEIAYRKGVTLELNKAQEASRAKLRKAGVDSPMGHLSHDDALVIFKLLKGKAPNLGITEERVPASYTEFRSSLYEYLTACGTPAYGDKVAEYLTK